MSDSCAIRVSSGRVASGFSLLTSHFLRSLASGPFGLFLAASEQAAGLRPPQRQHDVHDALHLPHPLGPVRVRVQGEVAKGNQRADVERDSLLAERVFGDTTMGSAENHQAEH